MKEICLEIIAHKALILCFNLTQCAQISYQGDEEKEREGDGSYSYRWGGETWHVSQCFFGQTKHTISLILEREIEFRIFIFLHLQSCSKTISLL